MVDLTGAVQISVATLPLWMQYPVERPTLAGDAKRPGKQPCISFISRPWYHILDVILKVSNIKRSGHGHEFVFTFAFSDELLSPALTALSVHVNVASPPRSCSVLGLGSSLYKGLPWLNTHLTETILFEWISQFSLIVQ